MKNLNIQLSLFGNHQSESQISQNEQTTDQLIFHLNESFPNTKIMKASSLIKDEEIQKKYLENNE